MWKYPPHLTRFASERIHRYSQMYRRRYQRDHSKQKLHHPFAFPVEQTASRCPVAQLSIVVISPHPKTSVFSDRRGITHACIRHLHLIHDRINFGIWCGLCVRMTQAAILLGCPDVECSILTQRRVHGVPRIDFLHMFQEHLAIFK